MADKRFCTSCGAPKKPSDKVCTQCGFRFGAGKNAGDNRKPTNHQPLPGEKPPGAIPGPETLPALIVAFIAGFIKNLPGMIRGMIIAAVISFVAVTLLHALLMVLFPDGAPGTDIPGSILAVAGLQSSPTALLFWFLLAAIFAFIYSQVKAMGAKKTWMKIASMPGWIAWSAKTAGISAFPLLMAGVSVALVARMFFLSVMTSIEFFILMIGILFSQRESLAVLAMRLGYSDLHRIVKKTGPALPSESLPVSGIVGAAAGFLAVFFIADTLFAVEIAVGLLVVGSVLVIFMRKRAEPRAVNTPVTAGEREADAMRAAMWCFTFVAVILIVGLGVVPAASAAAAVLDMGNGNTLGILMSPSGPKAPTTFTFTQKVNLVNINAYHYDAKGQGPPGTLGLVDKNGKMYGPWQTTGSTGQGGVKNAFWNADINVVLPAGTYTVVDSNPATWSYNAKSNNQGFAGVKYTIPGSPSSGPSGSSSTGHFAWPTAEAFAAAVATSALVGAFGFGGALFGAIVGGFTFIPPRGFQYPDRFGGGETPYDPGYSAGWGEDSDNGSGSSEGDGEGSDYSGGDESDGTDGEGPSDYGGEEDGGGQVGSGPAPSGEGDGDGGGTIYGDGSKENPFRDYQDADNPPWQAPYGDGSKENPYSDTDQPVNEPDSDTDSDDGEEPDSDDGDSDSDDGGSPGDGRGGTGGNSGSSSGSGSGEGSGSGTGSAGTSGSGSESGKGSASGIGAAGTSGSGPGPSGGQAPAPAEPQPSTDDLRAMYQGFINEGNAIDKKNAEANDANAEYIAQDATDFVAVTEGFKADLADGAYKKSQEAKDHDTWYHDYVVRDTALKQEIADRQNGFANFTGAATSGAEWTKYGCDKGIDVLAGVTGPAGKNIKTAYKIGTNLGEGLGEGMAEGGNFGTHIAKGAGKAAVDLLGDKLTDGGFKLGEKLLGDTKAGKVVGWLNKPVTPSSDPMAMRIFGNNKQEIAFRAVGTAAKDWTKGWGPSYGVDWVKDEVIGK